MRTAALALLATLFTSACTDEDNTRRALLDEGYTDVRVGGYAFFGCGKGDTFATEFRAKGPTGRDVKGVVCCGWLKDCTVRH